ncbi:MAG: hypothetical protein RR362_05695, partial [Raoultibacter sp.]
MCSLFLLRYDELRSRGTGVLLKQFLKGMFVLFAVVLAVGYGAKELGLTRGDTPSLDTSDRSVAVAFMTVVNGCAYAELNSVAQDRYVASLNALLLHRGSVYLGSTSKNDAQAAYYAVLADHPEIFWSGTHFTLESTSAGSFSGIKFASNYTE